eukprot:TRINITY_DN2899_c0_g1_i1.p1 TRINITY_DN2899_c0_g1~~TRINITY_DN2899_c0_g1_i1.p1  ORF type:complete len:319 (+),score=66.62 TRINITY_DN2899_c0_g1_i1:6-962(+)
MQSISQRLTNSLSYVFGANPQPFVQLSLSDGEQPPMFFQGSYAQAVDTARDEFKFLLVFLHSPPHSESSKFCRDVLSNPMVSSFLEDNFILWGASVLTEDGFKLSHTLGATDFPFFAILCHFSNTLSVNQQLMMMGYDTSASRGKAIHLHTIQGFVPREELLSLLTSFLEEHGPLMVAAKAEDTDRKQSRNLQRMQEEEFEESLRQDQERMEQREREEARRKEEERERANEEARKLEEERQRQLAIEREKQEQEMNRARLQDRKLRVKEQLAPEPEASEDTCTILIRLSSGRKLTRRFIKTDRLKVRRSAKNREESRE